MGNRALGHVDIVSPTALAGWAFDPKTGRSAPIEVLMNSEVYACLVPDLERQDLKGLVSPTGRHGFSLRMDPTHFVRGVNRIVVRFADTKRVLPAGDQVVTIKSDPALIAGLSMGNTHRGLWNVMHQFVHGDVLNIEAWGIAPPGARWATILSDGEKLSLEEKFDDNLRMHLWLPKDLAARRYKGTFRFPPGQSIMKLQFGSIGPFDLYQDLYFTSAPKLQPTSEQMVRVAGTSDRSKFETEGISNYIKIARLFALYGQKSLENAQVLDWGAGCGRVARYFEGNIAKLVGVDIDGDNITWCRNHLQGDFLAVDPLPPLPFADSSFDLIYGISVFTHLKEEHQLVWLNELARILAPTGIAILSVQGATAMMITGNSAIYSDILFSSGFADLGINTDLDGYVEHGYYRSIAHTLGYIYDAWGKFFDVLDIKEAIIGNFQDAVVLRAR